MELGLLLVFSLVVAMVFNWGQPRLEATTFGARWQGTYAGRTGFTALVIFGSIYLASKLLDVVYEKPRLP